MVIVVVLAIGVVVTVVKLMVALFATCGVECGAMYPSFYRVWHWCIIWLILSWSMEIVTRLGGTGRWAMMMGSFALTPVVPIPAAISETDPGLPSEGPSILIVWPTRIKSDWPDSLEICSNIWLLWHFHCPILCIPLRIFTIRYLLFQWGKALYTWIHYT